MRIRSSHAFLAFAVTLVLQPFPTVATTDSAVKPSGVAIIRTTAQPEQFCSSAGQMSFLPDAADGSEHPFLAEWASKRRFVVDQQEEGVTVMIVPPSTVRDTFSAVAELSRFFGLFSDECPRKAQVLRVLSTGVKGLDIVTNSSGMKDFNFTP